MPLSITPGPLEVLDNYTASFHNESPVREEEVWEVASREHGATIAYATTEANARAIAALPEFLEVLLKLEAWGRTDDAQGFAGETDYDGLERIQEAATTALRKAGAL